jgi:hypothetical protein
MYIYLYMACVFLMRKVCFAAVLLFDMRAAVLLLLSSSSLWSASYTMSHSVTGHAARTSHATISCRLESCYDGVATFSIVADNPGLYGAQDIKYQTVNTSSCPYVTGWSVDVFFSTDCICTNWEEIRDGGCRPTHSVSSSNHASPANSSVPTAQTSPVCDGYSAYYGENSTTSGSCTLDLYYNCDAPGAASEFCNPPPCDSPATAADSLACGISQSNPEYCATTQAAAAIVRNALSAKCDSLGGSFTGGVYQRAGSCGQTEY